jgi:D-alanyl-D-alanine carboxypeptidase
MMSRSESFKLRACLCALVLIEANASWTIAAGSNDLFTPAVARNLDHEIEDVAKRNKLPSVAVGVHVPGKGRYTFVEGFANLKTRTSRGFDQPFRVASITKTFAATAVLILIDRGLFHRPIQLPPGIQNFPTPIE